jgi:hypothetical protein
MRRFIIDSQFVGSYRTCDRALEPSADLIDQRITVDGLTGWGGG